MSEPMTEPEYAGLWPSQQEAIEQEQKEKAKLRAEIERLHAENAALLIDDEVNDTIVAGMADEIERFCEALERVCAAAHDFLLDCTDGGANPSDLKQALQSVAHLRKEKENGD